MKNKLLVGKINGVFGVQGWVKVFSYTSPKENIINYNNWLLKSTDDYRLVSIVAKKTNKTIIAKLSDINSVEQATKVLGINIYINKNQLKKPENSYYYYQLIGFKVINTAGDNFGIVDHLFYNGSNTVLVAKNDKINMLPFIKPHLISVNLAQKLIVFDWDIDF